MLQDWERRVKSAVGGVSGRDNQRRTIGRIQNLINVGKRHELDCQEKYIVDIL